MIAYALCKTILNNILKISAVAIISVFSLYKSPSTKGIIIIHGIVLKNPCPYILIPTDTAIEKIIKIYFILFK